jgi:hypothetical protein
MQNTQIGVQSVVGRVLYYWMLKVMVSVPDVVLYKFDCSTELPSSLNWSTGQYNSLY